MSFFKKFINLLFGNKATADLNLAAVDNDHSASLSHKDIKVFPVSNINNITNETVEVKQTISISDSIPSGIEEVTDNCLPSSTDYGEMLLSNSNTIESKPSESTNYSNDNLQIIFKKEIEEAFPYYFSRPEMENVDFVLNSENNEPIAPHIAFEEEFEEWKSIKSAWDRRSLLFTILDSLFINKIKLAQLMNRFTIDRDPAKALGLAKQYATKEHHVDPDFLCALGRANFYIGNYRKAKLKFQKCLKIDPKHRNGLINYADLLYSAGRKTQANEIYDQIICEDLDKVDVQKNCIKEITGYKGFINSPFFALKILESLPNATDEMWNTASEEFYYCAHFRAKHAYYLIKKRENLKGLAKLSSITIEMPWYKEAVLNTHSVIEQLGLDEVMEEDKKRLSDLIESNGWRVKFDN